MGLQEVQTKFKSDYGNNMHLWICTQENFYNEVYACDTIRVLVVTNTTCG
jgi:hypothetical protein